MLRPKITYLIFERLFLFEFGTAILLDAKTHSVPQFIGAPQRNFETTDLGIESSVQ